MKFSFLIATLFFFVATLSATDFHVEKQKLKFAFEHESFIDVFGNEVIAPGIKGNYQFKGKGKLGSISVFHIDYQTGLKSNLETSFQSGELASLLWSNRLNTSITIPFGKFYAGSNFYWRHKYVSEESNQFVDVFGGLGFRDVETSGFLGFFPADNWDVVATALYSDVNFKHFPESDSKTVGGSIRVSRRFDQFKLNLDYRKKKIDYNRPVFTSAEDGPNFMFNSFGEPILQEDRFQELGFVAEFLHPFYFSGGYSYQWNDSNNPGFAYTNHRFSMLIGTDLGNDFHLQGYGIAQRQDFGENGRLPVPVFLQDSDYDTIGISLVRTLNAASELEFGAHRLNNNSSFRELDASKYVLSAALNYRF